MEMEQPYGEVHYIQGLSKTCAATASAIEHPWRGTAGIVRLGTSLDEAFMRQMRE
jgi:hypothetical protein